MVREYAVRYKIECRCTKYICASDQEELWEKASDVAGEITIDDIEDIMDTDIYSIDEA